MRVDGRRTKKLIVAFHFQRSNQAAWKCDECRKKGLELKRRCGWLPAAAETPERVVWAREQTGITTCPVSYVSSESVALLEEFHIWKLFGWTSVHEMPARLVEAVCTIENQLRAEEQRAQD